MQTIKCLLLKSDVVLMAEVIEVGSELGEPDCKLVNPMKMVRLGDDYTLEPWIDFSDQNENIFL